MNTLKRCAVAAICIALLAQQSLMAADQPTRRAHDVVLHKGGVLVGQVVDQQGIPVAGVPVVIAQQGKRVGVTNSNKSGQFKLAGLRGGMTQVVAGNDQGVFRLWTAQTAPRGSQQGVLVVTGNQVVRGQMFGASLAAWALPAAAVGGVVAGVAVATTQSSSSPASP